MNIIRAAGKVLFLIGTAALIVIFFSGCGNIQDMLSTPTARVFSSVTPRPAQTTSPVISPEHIYTAVPTLTAAEQNATSRVSSGKVISLDNASKLELVVDAGKGSPLQIDISSDGRWLGVATTNGIYLYDPLSLEIRLSIRTGERQQNLAFSADSRFIASGDWHGKVSVWDLSGTLQLELDAGSPNLPVNQLTNAPMPAVPVMAVAFSPDGSLLAASGWDGSLRLWRISDGLLERDLAVRSRALKVVAFSPDGLLVYGWAPGESIQVWGVDDGKSREDVYLGKDPSGYLPRQAVFAQQGAQTAVLYTRSIKVLTTRNGFTRFTRPDLADGVEGLALSEDGNSLAVLSMTDQAQPVIEIYDLENENQVTRILLAENNGTQLMKFSVDGGVLFGVGDDLQRWDLTPGDDPISQPQTFRPQEFYADAAVFALTGLEGTVTLAGSNGRLDAFHFNDGTWSLMNASLADATGDLYQSIALLPGELAAFGDANGGISLMDLVTGDVRPLQGHTQAVRSLAINADGNWLASSAEDGKILLQNTAGAEAETQPVVTQLDAGSAAFRMGLIQSAADDNPYLILQTASNIQIWSLSDGSLLKKLPAQAMVISPDGSLLAGVANEGGIPQVNVYQLPDGEWVKSFPLEGFRLAISPDESLLAMGGKDLTLWSIADTILLLRLPDIPCCGEIQFSPDGVSLVQVQVDGSVQVWEIR